MDTLVSGQRVFFWQELALGLHLILCRCIMEIIPKCSLVLALLLCTVARRHLTSSGWNNLRSWSPASQKNPQNAREGGCDGCDASRKKPSKSYLVVSNIFYFHPYLGKWSNLTNTFQTGWNHQPESHCRCWGHSQIVTALAECADGRLAGAPGKYAEAIGSSCWI